MHKIDNILSDLPLSELPLFVEVARQQSFTKASEILGIPKSSISRRIASLEKRIGIKLLHRDARKVELTSSGQNLFARAKYIVNEAKRAFESVLDDVQTPAGVVRICASGDLFHGLVGDILCHFALQYPDIHLDIQFKDGWADLHKEPFDLDLRVGQQPDSSLIARKLATGTLSTYGSPLLLEKYPPIKTVNDLKDIPAITFIRQGNTWEITNGRQQRQIQINACYHCNSLSAAGVFAIRGLGIAMLPEVMCRQFVQAGRLRHLLPEWTTVNKPLYVVMANKELPLRVRMLVDFMVERFARIDRDEITHTW